jgi:hypothetical protein
MISANRLAACVGLAAAAIGTGLLSASWAQERELTPAEASADADVLIAAPDEVPLSFPRHFKFKLRHAGVSQEIREAAEKLRDAEGAEARQAATDELDRLLGQYFDDDLKRRIEELDRIKQRVEKLREQLARRVEKRQEIIDLQIKVLENEADGLGFFGEPGLPILGPMMSVRHKEKMLESRAPIHIEGGSEFAPPPEPVGAPYPPRRPVPPREPVPPR